MTFEADDIRDWREHDVVDSEGSKIGTLESVYFDTASQAATYASVRIGMIGRHKLTFVPLEEARVAPDHIRIMVDKKATKGAPTIELDGELTIDLEAELFKHYGQEYSPGATGERRLGRR